MLCAKVNEFVFGLVGNPGGDLEESCAILESIVDCGSTVAGGHLNGRLAMKLLGLLQLAAGQGLHRGAYADGYCFPIADDSLS